jgi:hypothetical protein
MLAKVKDFPHSTPGSGLQTLNTHLWGQDPTSAQLKVLNSFKTKGHRQAAVRTMKQVSLECMTAVVNHMAPGGQRMPELSAITLLEQESHKRRNVRVFASRLCVLGDYGKGEGLGDMELGYWYASELVSIHILRLVTFILA